MSKTNLRNKCLKLIWLVSSQFRMFLAEVSGKKGYFVAGNTPIRAVFLMSCRLLG